MQIDYSSFFSPETMSEIEEVINILLERTREIISDSIDPLIESVNEFISSYLKDLNIAVKEIMRNYGLVELSIPNVSVSLNNFDYVPQAPPVKDKSIKETAIENFHYNMDQYKNSKFVKFLKQEYPIFIRELTYGIIMYWIFKALGMQ